MTSLPTDKHPPHSSVWTVTLEAERAEPSLRNTMLAGITAVVIGILVHISSTIIFETSEGHKFNVAKVSMIVLGIGLACFV